jgi:hypothetical protein
LAEKSLIDDAVAAVDVGLARKKEHFVVAEGIAAGDLRNTSEDFAAVAMLARHTFCADHAPMEMLQTLENSTEGYGRSEGMVASSAWPP